MLKPHCLSLFAALLRRFREMSMVFVVSFNSGTVLCRLLAVERIRYSHIVECGQWVAIMLQKNNEWFFSIAVLDVL
ncbi:hypothetical protein F4604DRAFT_392375 [Suillus subluteus]|nr:hypothetical protein F4604DRAFT_392375 [Suillus subluteus]